MWTSTTRVVERRRLTWVLALLLAGSAQAHDFWIEPASYTPAPGARLALRLKVGERFQGEPYVRNPAHIVGFVMVDANGFTHVGGRPGSDPAGRIQGMRAGGVVIAYRSNPTFVELLAPLFEKYLLSEGFTRASAARAASGQTGEPGRESFARNAKSLLQVGAAADGTHTRALGLAFELVPETSPYRLAPGEHLGLQVLFRDAPLAGARVVAVPRGDPSHEVSAITGDSGRVSLLLDRAGAWLVRSVHLFPAPPGSAADWESEWASLTFELPPGP